MYAELGPQLRPAAVMPPSIDGTVQYTALIHDQNTANDPAGKTSLSQHSNTSYRYIL